MQTNSNIKEGEFRRFTPEEIGSTVMALRGLMDMKQITLAYEAGVSERTIQRIERGEKVDDETLKRVAKALKLPEETFVVAKYIPSPEEAATEARRAIENYQIIEIRPFAAAKDFDTALGSHGWLIDDKNSGDIAVREIAELKDLLEDWNCVYGDIPHTERLDACDDLFVRLREIERKGLVAKFGVYKTDDDFNVTVIIFVKQEPGLQRELTQAVVPRHFGRTVMGYRIRFLPFSNIPSCEMREDDCGGSREEEAPSVLIE